MRIGIDFDNTIACYDKACITLARELALVDQTFSGSKRQVSEFIQAGPNGKAEWMRLQGILYGSYITHAVPMPGVKKFLKRMRNEGFEILIVSHKTKYGHFDADRVNLRDAAFNWLSENGFFSFIKRENVFFEPTRKGKVVRIGKLGLRAFIDDLEEVFLESGFPKNVDAFLFFPSGKASPGEYEVCQNFEMVGTRMIEKYVFQSRVMHLTGADIFEIQPILTGKNNRVYRVETNKGAFALKWYLRNNTHTRDSIFTEFSALSFLVQHDVADVPTPLDHFRDFAIYEWIDGDKIEVPGDDDIDAAIRFVRLLHTLSKLRTAKDLPLATEACLSPIELIRQIKERLKNLKTQTSDQPKIANFLRDCSTVLGREEVVVRAELGGAYKRDLKPHYRTLSPSDFGFHNALRRADGSTVFLDMEYFGWDDPVKLICDFILHPGMSLTVAQKERFKGALSSFFASRDENFSKRLRLLKRLYGLRWCMIIMNEFLPEHWERRAFAGVVNIEAARARQFKKARLLFNAIFTNPGIEL